MPTAITPASDPVHVPEPAPAPAPAQLAKRRDVDAATTTIMLAEVPCDFTAEGILDQLRLHKLESAMNYFYFPPECARGRARGRRMTGPFYAFVNFVEPHWAQEAKRQLDGKSCTCGGVQWTIAVLRAEAQGVAQNLMKFRSVRRGDVSMFEDTWPHVRTERGLYAVHPVQAVKILHLDREVEQLRSQDRGADFLKGWAPTPEGKSKRAYDPRRPAPSSNWRPQNARRDKWEDHRENRRDARDGDYDDWADRWYPERYPKPAYAWGSPQSGEWRYEDYDRFPRHELPDMRWHELPGLTEPYQERRNGPLFRLEAEDAWFDDRFNHRARDLAQISAIDPTMNRSRPPARAAPPPQF